jgi:hypothetical protein
LKYIKLFEEHSLNSLNAQKADLDGLKDIGIISPTEYTDKIKDINRQIKSMLTTGSMNTMYSKKWFDDIRTVPEFKWLVDVVDSPEYSNLVSKGVALSSSFTQLMNHTLVFSKNQERRVESDYAIGFFGATKTVRRIVPKTGNRDMDMIIKIFKSPTEDDFFKSAMSYIADTIDFTTNYFSSKRAVKAELLKQETVAEFKKVMVEFIKKKMPGADDSQIRKLSDHLHALIGWNLAEIKPATKALKTWLTTDKTVNLSIYSYAPLDGELQQLLLNDPRLIVHNRAQRSLT